jgi:hypothetical protein
MKTNTFHNKCQRFYQRLEKTLGKRHKGEVIAIEAKSGQYVLGKDELAVALEAKKRFGKPVHFFRLGYAAVHKFRRNLRVKRAR